MDKSVAAEKTAADPRSCVEADRRPADPPNVLSPVQRAIERAHRDFESGRDWRIVAQQFINEDPSPLIIAIYQRAYFNCWLASVGHEDLILDLSEVD